MAAIEIKVPDIGDFKDVAIIEVLVKPGDTIAKEQSLVTVESDKASMEIPSSHAGVVKELKIKVGDKISEGSLLLTIESAAAAAPAAATPVRWRPAPTSNATCWCWAPAPAVTRRPSARPTSA
jgi:pyruvate/2-oxoglutarate dehydrogenase complex dihydrolipoamide acyltransferase (E2) component